MAEPARQPNPAHATPIPPAIRRQAELAEQLQRESIGETPPENGATAPAEPQDGVPPPTPPTPQPQPPPPPPPSAGDPDAVLRATQGRLDQERERNQQLNGRVGALEAMIADLQGQLRNRVVPPSTPPATLPPKGKLVTKEEEDDYGEELLAVMGKRARDEVAGEMEELRNEIKNLKGQVGQVGQRVVARDQGDLFSELGKAVPNWAAQNADPDFLAWLQQPEPWSGMKRHDILARAFDSNDANRVIRFFQGFLDEAAATGAAPVPTVPSSAPPTNGKVPLETFAAPGRANPAPASAPPGSKPTYTRAWIAQFYTDKAAGRWRGREADAANIELDLFRAGPEGRVIG